MSQGPLDLNFIKPRIEAALSNSDKGYDVSINHLELIWPEWNAPLLLNLKTVKIDQNEETALSINTMNLGLSTRHLFIGDIRPSILILEDPVFQLEEQDGEIRFFWDSPKEDQGKKIVETKKTFSSFIGPMRPSDKDALPKSDKQQTRQSIRDFVRDIFSEDDDNSNVLSALKRIALERAVVKMAPHSKTEQNEETLYLALVNLDVDKSNYGLQGNINITLPSDGETNSGFTSSVTYRRKERDITFTAQINDVNPKSFSRFFPELDILNKQDLNLDGTAQLAFNNQFRLQDAILNLSVPRGKITIPDLYEQGVNIEDFAVDLRFDRTSETLDVNNFKLNIGGIPINGSLNAQRKEGIIHAPLSLSIAEVETQKINDIFPQSLKDTNAGEWATDRITNGKFYDVALTTDLIITPNKQTEKFNITTKNTIVDFKGENITIAYSSTLMPVTDVSAQGKYADDSLHISGAEGNIADVKGRNIDLKLTNLSVAGGGMAYLKLDANGPFKTALKYASDEPIAMGQDLGFKVDDVKGNIDFKLGLEFPTLADLPKEQVIVKIDGTLTDLMIPNIVRGLPLTGGPFALNFADGRIGLEGKGKVGGRDADITWEEFVSPEGHDYESKITAKIIADAGLRTTFGIGLTDYLSGPLPLDVTYIDRGVNATIDVKGNLNPTTLKIDPFGYAKAAGIDGTLSLKALMKGDVLEEVNQLTVKTKDLTLSQGRLIFRTTKAGEAEIARGTIDSAQLRKTQLKVDFEETSNNVLKIVASGPVFDLKSFLATKETKSNAATVKAEDSQPMRISLETAQLLAEKNQIFKNAKIYLETDKQSDVTRLEMDGMIGNGPLYVRFKPDETTGKRIFRLESDDAGASLKALGLYDKITGGKLTIYGEPREGDDLGNLFGKAQIENFAVNNAPILANLLSALSLTGVQDALKNNGLSFAKLESDFQWQFRPEGNLLIMQKGRTSGSALGLTFEGVYNQGKSNIDISGTVIPLSGVNKAIGDIPIIGNILTGGKAFLAATYKIAGPSADPKVSINPLSVLAPGFIRNILFEESVESKVKKAQ